MEFEYETKKSSIAERAISYFGERWVRGSFGTVGPRHRDSDRLRPGAGGPASESAVSTLWSLGRFGSRGAAWSDVGYGIQQLPLLGSSVSVDVSPREKPVDPPSLRVCAVGMRAAPLAGWLVSRSLGWLAAASDILSRACIQRARARASARASVRPRACASVCV